jgi:hypothetical protein
MRATKLVLRTVSSGLEQLQCHCILLVCTILSQVNFVESSIAISAQASGLELYCTLAWSSRQ